MSGFSAKEFEPDPAIMREDDEASGGASPGAGHNRGGKPTEHAKVGEALLGAIRSRGEALCRIHDEKGRSHLWYYQDGLWTLLLQPTEWLEHAIEVMLRLTNKANKSKVRFITEVRKYIERSPDILVPGKISWDDHGKVPTRSGLIDRSRLRSSRFRRSITRPGASTWTTTRPPPVRYGRNCSGTTSTRKPPRNAKSASHCCRTFRAPP